MEHYEKQTSEFLEAHGLTIRAAFKGDKCPAWENEGSHIHGDCYRITIRRKGGRSVSFDFWNSQADSQNDKRPTPYDILSCVSADAFSPTDPDEVAAEYGDMKPSQAIAVARFAKRLQAFFWEDELEALGEIQ